MTTLSGKIIGAWVEFFKVKPTSKSSNRNILCFGIKHLRKDKYFALNEGRGGVGTYPPKWLESMAKNSDKKSQTSILLEYPPFSKLIELKKIEETIPVNVDPILAHSLKRLRPLFQTNGKARKSGWILDGSDLRCCYKYRTTGESGEKRKIELVRHGHPKIGLKGQSLHMDLPDDLADWAPRALALKRYYDYLTGLSNDIKAYKTFVNQIISATRNTNRPAKEAIFAQAAACCRPVFKNVLPVLKEKIVSYLTWKLSKVVEKTIKNNKEEKEEHLRGLKDQLAKKEISLKQFKKWENEYNYVSIGRAAIQYGLGEHLMNLYLLGNILQPEDYLRNVIIVAGMDHIDVIHEFCAGNTVRPIISFSNSVSGSRNEDGDVGLYGALPRIINLK